MVALVLLGFTIVPGARAYAPNGAGSTTQQLNDDFNLQFKREWNSPTEEESQTTIPDVDALVDNLTNFLEPGYTAYTGSQVPVENAFTKYHYQLNATYLSVKHDHDTIGPGDLFLRGFVNMQIDDDMTYTTDWTFDLGAWNDDEQGAISCSLYDGWAYDLFFWIELYDDDSGVVDSFGTWKDTLNWTQAGAILVDYGGDANVTFTLSLVGVPASTTATDILDAYKPYLFSDVETTYDDPAEAVYGRVIEGYDAYLGYNASCLQYLYFFPYEYTGSDHFVHFWDWEMILIFIDYSQGSRYPYRLAWDNGFYFAGPSGYDWIDGQEYKIFDDNIGSGTYQGSVEFSEQLWPVLGRNRTLKVDVVPISNVWDTGVENWGWFEWGMPTFQATIDTSYHQFDLGDASGTDPMDMDRDYPIFPFNDSTIRDAYRSLNTSFSGGVHPLDGYYTPNYAPFSWDISQPFEFPFLFNNYQKLATDINEYNGAKERKAVEWKVRKSVNVTMDVPCTVGLTLPSYEKPGGQVGTGLNFTLHDENAFLTIDSWYQVNLTASL
ncbi:MAG: hypothetical protein ACTSU5_20485, partial [Promethearchaeota archaeon]